jgi:hypothetical protein
LIHSLLVALLAAPAFAAEEEEEPGGPSESESESEDEDEDETEPELDDTLSRYRTPFAVLAEQSIGTTSRPVEFNWRRTTVQIAATGNHLFELNNFNSLRSGGMARVPLEKAIFEIGVSYVWVWDTPSSELLALTPYRQPGRPPRIEVDLTVGFPVAEGLVTTFPRLFPAAELVFSAYASLRYIVYPTGFKGMKAREVAAALVSPTITGTEVSNLDDARLDAMEVDSGRYGMMVGFGNEIYFKQGIFFLPRAMFAVPIFAPVTETELYFWADLSLSIGVAF